MVIRIGGGEVSFFFFFFLWYVNSSQTLTLNGSQTPENINKEVLITWFLSRLRRETTVVSKGRGKNLQISESMENGSYERQVNVKITVKGSQIYGASTKIYSVWTEETSLSGHDTNLQITFSSPLRPYTYVNSLTKK